MKLQQLKELTFESWKSLSTFNGAAIQQENFKPDVRKYGDLRRKATWEKAYASFWAQNIYDSCLDAYNLILLYFNYKPEEQGYEYRHLVFEEFLKFPDALDLLRLGMEQVFSTDFTPKEREEANGFFELVQQSGAGRIADRSIRQLASANAA